jgi:hypothetical protein
MDLNRCGSEVRKIENCGGENDEQKLRDRSSKERVDTNSHWPLAIEHRSANAVPADCDDVSILLFQSTLDQARLFCRSVVA